MTFTEGRALMRRELDAQPAILSDAAEALSKAAAGMRLPEGGRVWVGGCGDGLFAAQAMARALRGGGRDVRPTSAAEMLWDAGICTGDTVIGISISGSTRRTVEAIATAAELGARTLAVTLKPDGALAQAADDMLLLPFEPISRAIPHGLDYHVTLLALAALVGDVPGAAVRELFARRTGAALDEARAIAAGLGRQARFVFLGGGAALGSAGYGAAKLHEAGGLPAWAFEAENFAHGAQYMLRPGDHVVLCGAGGRADARTLAMGGGLERLGVTVGHAGFEEGDDPLLAALGAGLACQTLCLAVAEAWELDVTDPAGGSGADEVQRDWFNWTAP
jgi:fructoselysine-6-P-deglycase FrlB-like protein